WPEGIYLAQCHSTQFCFQLTTYSQVGSTLKKVFFKVDSAIFVAGCLVKRQSSYFKHFARTFRIACGNYRRVQVHKPTVVKKLMYGKCQAVAHTKYGTESIGAETQVRYLAQVFQA